MHLLDAHLSPHQRASYCTSILLCQQQHAALNIFLAAAAVLLERQTVVFSPNVGVLTSVVLSMIPLVRPFAWQSLLLPVLPCTEDMLDLLQVVCCC